MRAEHLDYVRSREGQSISRCWTSTYFDQRCRYNHQTSTTSCTRWLLKPSPTKCACVVFREHGFYIIIPPAVANGHVRRPSLVPQSRGGHTYAELPKVFVTYIDETSSKYTSSSHTKRNRQPLQKHIGSGKSLPAARCSKETTQNLQCPKPPEKSPAKSTHHLHQNDHPHTDQRSPARATSLPNEHPSSPLFCSCNHPSGPTHASKTTRQHYARHSARAHATRAR